MNNMTLDYALKEGFVDLRRTRINSETGGQKFTWDTDVRRCPFTAKDSEGGLTITNRKTGRSTIVDFELLDTYGVDSKNVVADFENVVVNLIEDEPNFGLGDWQGGDDLSSPNPHENA